MTEDPRLTLADVERLVGELGDETLRALAEGPMPGELCRLCGVLKTVDWPAATELLGWHEFFDETPGLDEITKNWRHRDTEEERHRVRRAFGEWKRVSGMLSYARCSMVYLAARLELAKRS